MDGLDGSFTIMKIAVCVGHSRSGDDGAVSVDGATEWGFNLQVADDLRKALETLGHEVIVVNNYIGNSYGAAMRWLGDHLRELGVDVAVELHFNSSDNPAACGHEWLHWHASKRGRALALGLEKSFNRSFPESVRRGVKPLGVGQSDRGADFVRRTHCPAVICEPFFGSNKREWAEMKKRVAFIASAMAKGISNWALENS